MCPSPFSLRSRTIGDKSFPKRKNTRETSLVLLCLFFSSCFSFSVIFFKSRLTFCASFFFRHRVALSCDPPLVLLRHRPPLLHPTQIRGFESLLSTAGTGRRHGAKGGEERCVVSARFGVPNGLKFGVVFCASLSLPLSLFFLASLSHFLFKDKRCVLMWLERNSIQG